MILAILFTFAAAAVAPFLVPRIGRASGWVLALVPLGLFAYFATWIPQVIDGETVRVAVSWVPQLSVELAFVLDGLSLLFALLVTSLGTAIIAYAGVYMRGHRDLGRFFFALIAFMGAMLGLVLADDLIAMFVFWELTSITSYLLIGFKHEKTSSRDSALQALLVTGGGGLALLAGVLLLAAAGGTTSISELLQVGSQVTQHSLYLPAFALIALGAFTKSAQFPFHFWLPNAMAAPTPVSAFLHSATMVKAGVYVLARVDPILGGTPVWTWTLCVVGAMTMIVGAVAAVRHTDLKKVLAYSTITALGTLVGLIGLSTPAALKAAVVFLIVHSLYKSVLFLVAGIVDHETGTRDLREVGGLRAKMPYTFGAALLAGLSMAGLPPLFGFVGKELAYKAKLGVEGIGWVLPSVAVVANALTIVAAALLVLRPFFGPLKSPKPAHEAPFGMWVGPVVIGACSLIFGVVPGLLAGLVAPAVDVIAGEATPIKLALWYGVDNALLLSVLTMLLGGIGIWQADRIRSVLTRFDALAERGPQAFYQAALRGLPAVAAWQTSFFEGQSLRTYLGATIGTMVALTGGTYLWLAGPVIPWSMPEVSFIEGVVFAMTAMSALAVAVVRSRLVAVTALGAVGVGVALLFVLASAPDLAMTQFLVEILIVVIVLLVMQHLPRPVDTSTRARKMRDAVLAVAAGGLVTTLVLAVHNAPLSLHLSEYFNQNAVPGGFGRNVVNVILVDFRALDTLGEVAVIAIAALGALVLVKMNAPLTRASRHLGDSVVLQTATRLLMAVLLLASLFMLWRGHNEPGGGFIGGLVAGAALVLYTMAYQHSGTERILRVAPRALIGTGLGVALLSGLLAWAQGQAYLTGLWMSVNAGGAPLKLGTPLLFDVGVFLAVVGVVLTMVLAMERVSTSTSTDEGLAGTPDLAGPPYGEESGPPPPNGVSDKQDPEPGQPKKPSIPARQT